jgi:methyl coenzyme M reductase alpha subunit
VTNPRQLPNGRWEARIREGGAVVTEPDLTPREVADLSTVSYWTVLQEIKRGNLTAYRRPGGRLAVRHEDYVAWAYGDPVVPAVLPARERRGRRSRGSVSVLRDIEEGAA